MATLADALAECLDALRSGEDIEDCLRRHGRYREQLRMLLEVARRIPTFPKDALLDCQSTEHLRRRIAEIARDLDAEVGRDLSDRTQPRSHGRKRRRSA